MEDVGFEEDSFMSMLNSGEEESYPFSSAPSSMQAPSSFCCYSSCNAASHMLCFGGKEEDVEDAALHGILVRHQKSSDSSMSSFSSSPQLSSVITNTTSSAKNTKATKKEGSGDGGRKTTSLTTVTRSKKPKKEDSTGESTVKVRKEKLGERILTLQQLVSPFGKSDTASVLQEALGYIRFLHDQVQVLSSPYMRCLPTSGFQDGRVSRKSDLRSQGICLVPIAYTEFVVSSNGADLWSPAAMGSSSNCSPSSKH